MRELVCVLMAIVALTIMGWLAFGLAVSEEQRCHAMGGEQWCWTPSMHGPYAKVRGGVGTECECRIPKGDP